VISTCAPCLLQGTFYRICIQMSTNGNWTTISLPAKGAGSIAAFEPGNITKRVIKIPQIHTTVPKTCRRWLNVSIHRFILQLRWKSSANAPKGTEIYLYIPIPQGGTAQYSSYLDFLVFFLSFGWLLTVFFESERIHSHSRSFFLSILITPFVLKLLSNNLIFNPKKFDYLL